MSPTIQNNQFSIFLLAINHIPTTKIAVVTVSTYAIMLFHILKTLYTIKIKIIAKMNKKKEILYSYLFIFEIGFIVIPLLERVQ